MAGTYIVALELGTRVDIEVTADDEEEAIQKAFTHFDANFDSYRIDIKYGEWDAEVVERPEEET